MHDLQHLRVFCFLFSSFTENGRGEKGKEGKEKASIKKKPQGFSLRLKFYPWNSFLPSLVFSFVRCKNNKKSFRKTNHNIYTTSIWQLPPYICKKVFFSTCTNFNTWSLSSDSGIENSWRTKVDFGGETGFLNIFLQFLKDLTSFQPRKKIGIYL